jgi:5-formyltetrahydrofolate cyclo-ligase
MPDEISTLGILDDAFQSGKKVFIPYIHFDRTQMSSSVMEMLALHSKLDFEKLEPDKWGIPSLPSDSIKLRENCMGFLDRPNEEQVGVEEGEGGLDIIFMPGMAFDEKLQRLGHGKGYYDRFLKRYCDHMLPKGQKMPFLGEIPIITPEQKVSNMCYLQSDLR